MCSPASEDDILYQVVQTYSGFFADPLNTFSIPESSSHPLNGVLATPITAGP